MNTHTFIQLLQLNQGKELFFQLPDGHILEGDLHITEIKDVKVKSVDCGSNSHSFGETLMQLYINENNADTARWTTDKALGIVNIVEKENPLQDEAEFFIEYGDRTRPTMKYAVENILNGEEQVKVELYVKPVGCKPAASYSPASICC